ncbi:unnamed protein product, partial [Rotaria socialis]
KLATSSGFADTEWDSGGPIISEESSYRYTSIFQVCSIYAILSTFKTQ